MKIKGFENPWGPILGRIIYQKMTTKRQLYSKNDRPSNMAIPSRLLQHLDIKIECPQKCPIYRTKPDIFFVSGALHCPPRIAPAITVWAVHCTAKVCIITKKI
jgi:hypothetical protein